MSSERKVYSKYIYNRGLRTLWKGDPATPEALYRSIALTSPHFNSTTVVFQVLALEGVGRGVENGKFAGTDGEPTVLFDNDFHGVDAAAGQFHTLTGEAESLGFETMTFGDQIEFERKLRESKD